MSDTANKENFIRPLSDSEPVWKKQARRNQLLVEANIDQFFALLRGEGDLEAADKVFIWEAVQEGAKSVLKKKRKRGGEEEETGEPAQSERRFWEKVSKEPNSPFYIEWLCSQRASEMWEGVPLIKK